MQTVYISYMQLRKWTFIFTAIIGILLIIFPGIDLAISNYFYVPGEGFVYAKEPWAQAIFRGIPIVAVILVISLVLGILFKFFVCKNKKDTLKSPMIFLLIALAFGPGLSVNLLLKENFGRARPSQVTELGGTKEFSRAGHYVDQCQTNCSFSSGHASMGFYFTSFSYIVPALYQAAVFTTGALFGSVVGIGRIVQGGHFFSDVIFSFLVIMLMNEISFRIWLIAKKK